MSSCETAVICSAKPSNSTELKTISSLLDVGGVKLIDRQVDVAKAAGVKNLYLVCGNKRREVGRKRKFSRVLNNENYKETTMSGSISIFLNNFPALKECVFIAGDIFFDEKMISSLLSYNGNCVVLGGRTSSKAIGLTDGSELTRITYGSGKKWFQAFKISESSMGDFRRILQGDYATRVLPLEHINEMIEMGHKFGFIKASQSVSELDSRHAYKRVVNAFGTN